MMDHVESKGFLTDFIQNEDFDLLLAPLYDNPYVIIVGWFPSGVPQNKMYHCSPVRLVSQRNIGLTNIGRHGIEKLTKEKFDPL